MCLSPTHSSFENYIKEIQNIIDSNKPYFLNYSSTSNKPKMVVFDIDDTLLSTVGMNDSCFVTFPRIKPVVEFYYFLKKLGYRIVLITARQQTVDSITKKNLISEGIVGYDDLFSRSMMDNFIPIGLYKMNKRKYLSDKYDIVGNIGDQTTDFYGGYNGKSIKLPNF